MATVPPCRAAGEEGWVICGGHRAQISGSQSVVWELLGIPKIFSRRLQGFNYFKKNLFIWLHQVLVTTRWIFSLHYGTQNL